MKKIVSICIMMLLSNIVFSQNENLASSDIEKYIQKYKPLAIAEQKRTGVPAAITLAQGIHESSSGLSELATQANNHFGIKCKNTWTGPTYLHDDDRKQECFRKYLSDEQSYIDHSDFLKNSKRYETLFSLDPTNYLGWASGLKNAGYATNPLYVKRLTGLIEKYNLQQYTYEALGKKSGEVVPEQDNNILNQVHQDPSKYFKGTKGFWASKGDLLLEKAVENKVRYQKLLSMNDLKDEPLQHDMFIFLERKRTKGSEEFHIVKEDENMQLIAQREAMELNALYELNNMIVGQEPLVGEQLFLQYKNSSIPTLKKNEAIEKEIVKQVEKVVPVQIQEKPEVNPFPTKETNIQKIENNIVQHLDTTNPLVLSKDIYLETLPDKSKKIVDTIIVIKENGNDKVSIDLNNPNIIDAEKAKRMEALLKDNAVEKEVVKMDSPTTNTVAVIQDKVEIPQEVKIIEPKIAEPQASVRTYNEEGVSDSVKDLKRKFDLLIYSNKAPVKPVEKPKVEIKKQEVTKEIRKDTIAKKIEIKKNKTVKDTIVKANNIVKKNVSVNKVEAKKNIDKIKLEVKKEVQKPVESKLQSRYIKKEPKQEIKKVEAKISEVKKISNKKADLKKMETPKEVVKKVDSKKKDLNAKKQTATKEKIKK